MTTTSEQKVGLCSNRGKHPDFDAYWAEHKRLVFWYARKIARTLGGIPRDYWGTLVIHFNHVLFSFNPERGTKFSGWFLRSAWGAVLRYFYRWESEHNNLRFWREHSSQAERYESLEVKNLHEMDYYLFRIPERGSDWAKGVIELFNSSDEAWLFLVKGLPQREAIILEKRFRWGISLEEIGKDEGVTKERIRQLEARALNRVRERARGLEAFAELFDGRKV